MNYRLQDFIKYIIPGLYVIFFVFIWSVLSSNCHIETAKLKDFTSIIIFAYSICRICHWLPKVW